MEYIKRLIAKPIKNALARNKSVLLLGARQTGKTTLLSHLPIDLSLSFIQPAERQRYEQNPSALTQEIEAFAMGKPHPPLVSIDEVQKVPEIMDVVQDLIDRRIAQFILTGSSARKLRARSRVNLLPGRVVALRLDPLIYTELAFQKPLLEDLLLYGSLPGIILTKNPADKQIDLDSYVTTYLEEEIRSEAIVRNVASFARFINLAASESGNILNFTKLSQEIGVAHTTIAAYYQILEDCLIIERIEPLTHTKIRRRLTKTPKYLFFDLGIRRVSAVEGISLPTKHMGLLFEQWVGLELIYRGRLTESGIRIFFWRDTSGPEIDWIIEKNNQYIPIEVKWTDQPVLNDAKHLQLFLNEYPNTKEAYLICRAPRKMKLAENIFALPWQLVDELF